MPEATIEANRPGTTLLRAPTWNGAVTHLHITARAFLPMRAQESVELVAGRGIMGDRYMIDVEQGYYSEKPEEGRQVTLFEARCWKPSRGTIGSNSCPRSTGATSPRGVCR